MQTSASVPIATTESAVPTTASTTDSVSPPPRNSNLKYPWMKEPGPIAGRWKVTCDEAQGMVVEFKVDGKTATGRIAVLGKGGFRTYRQGEDILKVTADDYGDWVGELHWRGPAGKDHMDSIRMVASADKLNATMTTDGCYKDMPRVK